MEVVDEATIQAVNKHSKLALEEKPTLFLEFHGTEVSARDQVELFRQIAEAEGAIRFDWAEKEEDRRRLWKARHEFYWAVKTTWPGPRGAWPPTSACRSRGWPNACWRRRRTSSRWA